ncbi:MAG TPA: ABC transporter substrate-binding protein [Noviherbaspirillum sp.]|nr:ABC transporter substrate-binding protein [Noviherbaspirillum sp.]
MNIKHVFVACIAAGMAAGACADEIRIGIVSGMTGPIAETAEQIAAVSRGYVDMINARGGINGSRLALVIKDDQYDPRKTAPLVEEAIEQDKVVALVNSAGTSQTIGVMQSRVLNRHKVPLIGVFSGSGAIRGPGSEEIFHTRLTYHDEVLKIARLASTLGLKKVAVLHQDDAFGEAILKSVAMAEKEYGLEVIAKAAYQPGTKDFAAQARQIVKARPQAIFLMSVPDATYQFMKAYDAPHGASQIYALSFVTPKMLAETAGEAKARGVGISQVVPNPNATSMPLVKDFNAFLSSPWGKGIDASPVTLEGYLNVRLAVEAIRAAGPRPTGEKVMQSLAAMRNHQIGGFPIDFSAGRRSGSSYLDIAVVGRNAKLMY